MKQSKWIQTVIMYLGMVTSMIVVSGCAQDEGGNGGIGAYNNGGQNYPGGCIPLNANQPISFYGQNSLFAPGATTSTRDVIVAGTIPSTFLTPYLQDPGLYYLVYQENFPFTIDQKSGVFGSLSIGNGGAGGAYTTFPVGPTNPDGTVSMNITPVGGGTYLSTISGVVTISQSAIDYNGFGGYNYTNPPCVSGIAISLGVIDGRSGGGTMTTLSGGRVYLYLNGLQHGIYLRFGDVLY